MLSEIFDTCRKCQNHLKFLRGVLHFFTQFCVDLYEGETAYGNDFTVFTYNQSERCTYVEIGALQGWSPQISHLFELLKKCPDVVPSS